MTVQSLLVLWIAAVAAVLVAFGGWIAGEMTVQRWYFSDEAVTRRLAGEIRSFRDYVAENQVESTDVAAVEAWNRNHRFTQLTIKALNTTISSAFNGAELMANESGLVVQSGKLAQGGREYAVHFADGSFAVTAYETSETVIHQMVRLIGVAVGAVVFLIIMILYDQYTALSIQTLSRQVRQVSRGELDLQIYSNSRNEIGQLARDVDNMRLSIMEKLKNEEAAWAANSQLITAISHDVRTPLTALMGYLELLDEENLSPEERRQYLEVCKNHAFRLKGLTDELFGFFLVFGNPNREQHLEEIDGAMLMDQILMEQELTLGQQGFDVRFVRCSQPVGLLRVDVGHLRRAFDNLFSNVVKYADPAQPVGILETMEDGWLHVTISNAVAQEEARVESNRIGLQTTARLIANMGGKFVKHQSLSSFTAEVALPVFQEEKL